MCSTPSSRSTKPHREEETCRWIVGSGGRRGVSWRLRQNVFFLLSRPSAEHSSAAHPKGRNEVKESRSEAERLDGARCGATVSERGRKIVVRETRTCCFLLAAFVF